MSKMLQTILLDSSINILHSFEETCFVHQKDDARLEANYRDQLRDSCF